MVVGVEGRRRRGSLSPRLLGAAPLRLTLRTLAQQTGSNGTREESDETASLPDIYSVLLPRFKLEAHKAYVLKTVFSPDGRHVSPVSLALDGGR